ncbi:MAG: hypothetical protein P1P84_02730 [Deferrisomatales bacterium]|nr:hypothetical protein [Deferrisomatales bacterium]
MAKKKIPAVPAVQTVSEKTLQAEELPPVIVATQEEITILGALAAGKTPRQATQAAGLDVNPSVATAYCGGLQRKYNDAMVRALHDQGLHVGRVAAVLDQQVGATKFIPVRGEGLVEVPDNPSRLAAVRTVLDILPGAWAPKVHEVETRSLEAILMKIVVSGDDDD